jgi:outer membrane lipoprotein SlyB
MRQRFMAAIISLVMLVGMIPLLSTTASAQKYYYYRDRAGRMHRTTKKPSFYRRHRNASNIGLATGAGAVIGALAGGRKGALIGAGVGAGSGAVYTYKVKKKKRHYVKRRY